MSKRRSLEKSRLVFGGGKKKGNPIGKGALGSIGKMGGF